MILAQTCPVSNYITAPYCTRKQASLSDERMWSSSQINFTDLSIIPALEKLLLMHASHCRRCRQVQGRVMPSLVLDDNALEYAQAQEWPTHTH